MAEEALTFRAFRFLVTNTDSASAIGIDEPTPVRGNS